MRKKAHKKITSVLLIPNPKKPKAIQLAKQAKHFLAENGIGITKKSNCADFLLLISGDGTVLYNKDKYDLPIFAIGHERSQICQAKEKNWKQALASAIKNFTLDERAMLSCFVNGKHAFDSLNDVVVRGRNHRVVKFRLEAPKHSGIFFADGIIFATPTGSTAYSYSCGGPKLNPHAGTRKYVVAAIAPYKRSLLPFVLPDSAVSRLTVLSSNADLVFDGQLVRRLAKNAKLVIKKSKKKVKLIKLR